MSDQAYKTPLIDLLRNVPKDHRTQWSIQWAEDGRETGHAICPIGRLAHEAADRIVELEALQHSGKPVAWLSIDSIGERYLCFAKPKDNDACYPLYTAQQLDTEQEDNKK